MKNPTKVYVIDNDDVTYECSPFRDAARRELNLLIEKAGRTPDAEYWNKLIAEYGTGFHPYIYSHEFNIPFRTVIASLIQWVENVPVEPFVQAEQLARLDGPCVLFTENSSLYAEHILRKSGLRNQFDYILSLESFHFVPKTKAYQHADSFIRSIYGPDVKIIFIDDSVGNLELVPPKLDWRKFLLLASDYTHGRAKQKGFFGAGLDNGMASFSYTFNWSDMIEICLAE